MNILKKTKKHFNKAYCENLNIKYLLKKTFTTFSATGIILFSIFGVSCKHVQISEGRQETIKYEILTPELPAYELNEQYKNNLLKMIEDLAIVGYQFYVDENGFAYFSPQENYSYTPAKFELSYKNIWIDDDNINLIERGSLKFRKQDANNRNITVSIKDAIIVLDDLMSEAVTIAKIKNNSTGIIKLTGNIVINELDHHGRGCFQIISVK